jgi:hypothetical protein
MNKFDLAFSMRAFPDVVMIVDEYDSEHPSRRITNAAGELVDWLVMQGLKPEQRVIYRDTQGYWDEIAVRNGRFVGFKPIRVRSLAQALLAIRPAMGRA